MMIPNLIIPGAGKSGTSSLHEYLDLHPDIEMSRIKEPHFFTFNERYEQGLDFYKNLFNNKNVVYWGESSTAYFGDELARQRIKESLDNVKFIIILRNPVDRSISHYLWQVSLLQEFRSFRKALIYNMKNPVDFRKPGWGGHTKGYYEGSLYGERMKQMINKFGKKNIHVITLKELITDLKNALNGCFIFLGLKPIDISVNIKANPTKDIPSSFGYLKSFVGKTIYRGVLDFRLLYLALNRKVGKISNEDKLWLRKNLEEDLKLLDKFYPGIEERW